MTSIEWLIQVLAHNDIIDHKLLSTREDKYKLYKRLVEQAKEMHKKEIIKSYEFGQNDGWNTRENDYNKNYHKKGTGESYYNYEFNYKYGEL